MCIILKYLCYSALKESQFYVYFLCGYLTSLSLVQTLREIRQKLSTFSFQKIEEKKTANKIMFINVEKCRT